MPTVHPAVLDVTCELPLQLVPPAYLNLAVWDTHGARAAPASLPACLPARQPACPPAQCMLGECFAERLGAACCRTAAAGMCQGMLLGTACLGLTHVPAEPI